MLNCTYASHNRRVILLAIVYGNWLIIGAGGEDTAVVVHSSSHEFLSVGRVGKVGGTGRI